MMSINVCADDYSDYYDLSSTEEVQLAFLQNHGVDSICELTAAEDNELSVLLQNFKNSIYGIDNQPIFYTALSDFTGGIFLQFSSHSSLWNHGHAGIGHGTGVIEILNPDSTVQKYGQQRIQQWYNETTGGFYTVRGASLTDNTNASNKAYNKIGTGYWLIGDTGNWGGYTCSSLVAVSWGEAGFNLGGRTATPESLRSNSNTILQFNWADVDY